MGFDRGRRTFIQAGGALLLSQAAPRIARAARADSPFADVVVFVPGIMGSVLERGGSELWGPSLGSLFRIITARERTFEQLRLHPGPQTGEVVATRIFPDLHLVPGLWKIDGYSTTMSRLEGMLRLVPSANLFAFPYDWRRDIRLAARELQRRSAEWLDSWRAASGNADARLVLVAHSMGGLVCRYFTDVLGGWRNTRHVLTLGTPYRGSAKALGYLANGYRIGAKPIGTFELSPTVRSFESIYQLLPPYACVSLGNDRLLHGVSDLPPPVGELDLERARAGLEFHRELDAAVRANLRSDDYRNSRYRLHAILSSAHPTFQWAELKERRLTLLNALRQQDFGGDGIVPGGVLGLPTTLPGEASASVVVPCPQTHSSIQNADSVLAYIGGALGAPDPRGERAAPSSLRGPSVRVADYYAAGEPVVVPVALPPGADAAQVRGWMDWIDHPGERTPARVTPVSPNAVELRIAPPHTGLCRVGVDIGPAFETITDVCCVVDV